MRRLLRATLLVLACWGCAREEEAGESAAAPPAAEPRVTRGEPCPASDFPAFFARFTEDTALQRRWTRFPLVRSSIANDGPEPRQVTDTVPVGEVSFPLLPSEGEVAESGREVAIGEREGGGKQVTIFKRDTDWTTDFIFAPHSGCWRLVRIEDWSL